MYSTAYETIQNITSGWDLWGVRRYAVLRKWIRVWKKTNQNKTRTVCGMYYTREYVFSWDIWRYQQELLYWGCDKWLYSQFTFFCFSVLLECSLACSSPCVYFCHFSLLLSRKFPHLIFYHVGEHAHTETIINQVQNKQTLIKVTFMSTTMSQRENNIKKVYLFTFAIIYILKTEVSLGYVCVLFWFIPN